MISRKKIHKYGKALTSELVREVILKTLQCNGTKISESKDKQEQYTLYCYPADNPTCWFVDMGNKKRLIQISPTKIALNIEQQAICQEKRLNQQIEKYKDTISVLRSKLLKIRTKKNSAELETQLNKFIELEKEHGTN